MKDRETSPTPFWTPHNMMARTAELVKVLLAWLQLGHQRVVQGVVGVRHLQVFVRGSVVHSTCLQCILWF